MRPRIFKNINYFQSYSRCSKTSKTSKENKILKSIHIYNTKFIERLTMEKKQIVHKTSKLKKVRSAMQLITFNL